jgi:hypothetical protein
MGIMGTDRRRAAIRAVLHRVTISPLPPGAASNVAGNSIDKAVRREREMAILRQCVQLDWRVWNRCRVISSAPFRGEPNQ